jgi:hypothetical protein
MMAEFYQRGYSSMLKATERYSQLKEQYEKDGIILIKQFFDESFLERLETYFTLNFKKTTVMKECNEFLLEDEVAGLKLSYIFNTDQFIRPISNLTGTPKECIARMYYNDNTCNNLTWHDDSYAGAGRFAAIRIEFSKNDYSGGEFLFKDRVSEKQTEYSNLNYGDAVLFKVKSNQYYHMVNPVLEGTRRSLIIFLTHTTTIIPDDTIQSK